MSAAGAAPDLLGAIVAGTRQTVALRVVQESLADLRRRAAAARPQGDRFAAALSRPDRVNVIAECKRRSPSRGVLATSYDPAAIARRYVEGGAAAISVLTEPTFFDGALAHLRAVREAVDVPVLRKDFIVSVYQVWEARATGADALLLIAAALDDETLAALLLETRTAGLAALVEVHDETEARRAVAAGAAIVGVNNRSLRNLQVDTAASHRLAQALPSHVIAVSESGLKSADDLRALRQAGYRAFLVGERLMTSPDPVQTLRELTAM